MRIYPAIDLYEGKAVRLYQGDYDRMTVYSSDPCRLAQSFAAAGAKALHLVDLEGAREGTVPHLELVRRIRRESGLFCEIGGGIRDMKTVEAYLFGGLERVVLGTAAVTDRGFLKEALAAFGPGIAVGADLRDGFVAVKGWLEKTRLEAFAFLAELEQLGVRTVICTDISRDGALTGPNGELYRRMKERFSMEIVASGGISSLDDLKALSAIGLDGAIVGRALYTGAVDLGEAVRTV